MTIIQIITTAGRPIEGLGPWRHSEVGRHTRIIKALSSYEFIPLWSYITFAEWTRAQACLLAKHLNDVLVYRHWQVLNHPRHGLIIYYEPHLLAVRGPDSFEIPALKYHYPFNKCVIAGNWFKVRNTNIHVSVSNANRPDRLYRYALDPVHGHIIYRAL